MKRVWFGLMMMVALLGSRGVMAAQEVPAAGEVREFFVEDARVIGLSPDGEKYAVFIPGTALCVSDAATLERITCASIEEMPIRPRPEDIVWSPDSTRLAFGEQSYIYGDDGDLWVMDATSGTLTNLTDDGFDGSLFSLDEPMEGTFYVDVAPAWTPDGQYITFSRSTWVDGERGGNDIAQIPAEGGAVETLTTVSADSPGVVFYGTGWSPDGATFYFTMIDFRADNPENGIWAYDRESGETRVLAVGDDEKLGPLALLDVSPAGDALLAWYPQAFGQFMLQDPLLRLVDTATGELTVLDVPVASPESLPGLMMATFSPDGMALLQLVDPGEEDRQIWVTDLRTGEQTMVVESIEGATIEQLAPTWGANGNAMVAHGLGAGYLIPISGIGLEGVAAPAQASPVASPVAGAFAPGSDVVTTELTPVFASPDPNAAVVLLLVPNQMVQIVAAPVENAFGVWYPVVDPETQTIGYVQANRLGTTSGS